jgi:hypothetical protein
MQVQARKNLQKHCWKVCAVASRQTLTGVEGMAWHRQNLLYTVPAVTDPLTRPTSIQPKAKH